MEQRKKKSIRNIIFTVLVILATATLVVLPFLLEAKSSAEEDTASILSGTVETGSISRTLSGAGTLTEEETLDVTVPEGVEITAYRVADGDTVKEGDIIATVDRTSVMQTISSVQETLEALAEDMEDVADAEADTVVTAETAGRVKAVYAQTGDSVRSVTLEHGALAILSIDGSMAVKVDASASGLKNQDKVLVTLSDGTQVDGKVESILSGSAVVLISDEYGSIGEEATVCDLQGASLGTGTLYVHSEWRAEAYTGTVSAVKIQLNQKVSANGKLFSLKDTADSSAYQILAAQHREYEDIMAQLFILYQDGCVKANGDGVISGVNETLVKELCSDGEGEITLLKTPAGGSDDSAYSNRLGKVVSVDSAAGTVTMAWNADASGNLTPAYSVTDYTVYASGELTQQAQVFSQDAMTYGTVTPRNLYKWDAANQQWTSVYWLSVGDIYLVASDAGGNTVWLIYMGHTEDTQSGGQGGDSGNQGTTEGQGGQSSGSDMSAISGSISLYLGGVTTTEEDEELYSTDTTTICSITPQNELTITITIDELDILLVSLGQQAQVTLDAFPGQSFDGTITEINTAGSNSGGNSKYTAVITLPRQENMMAGMNATGIITVSTSEHIALIPVEALVEEGNETFVYTGYDEKSGELTGKTPVETGVSDGTNAELLSGLSEGQTYWYAVYDTLEIEKQFASMPQMAGMPT